MPASTEQTRADLWLWPTTAAVGAIAAAVALSHVDLPPGSGIAAAVWPGDVAAARGLLQTVATAAVTTLTLTFTVTIVALQLASQQFSPRLLRDFLRDRVTKIVLAVLVATFVYVVTVQRRLDEAEQVPVLAMLGALLLALGSVAALLGFINHIMRRLRVETMMLTVHNEAARAIHTFYPDYGDPRPQHPDSIDLRLEEGTWVPADRSGFVRMVDVEGLVTLARDTACVIQLEARPGDHVVKGTPAATIWAWDGHGTPRRPDKEAVEHVSSGLTDLVVMGYERTVEQDAAFGFRQLTDIAVKALSPGINDPVTAAHAVGHAADLLLALTTKRLGPTLHLDQDGTGRAIVPDRDMRYYLDLSCGQVRRYGEAEPTVLLALLRMLRDVGAQTRDEHQRAEVERQVQLVLTAASSLPDHERPAVDDLAERARQALRGDVLAAYRDRSGETRSI